MINKKKDKNPNRKKYSSFSEFILNDDKIVMKLLLTIAKWVGPILFSWLAILFLFSSYWPVGIIFGIFGLVGWYKLYQFYKIGGSKNLEGMTAAEMVWNKEQIKVGKQTRGENNVRKTRSGIKRQTKEKRKSVR